MDRKFDGIILPHYFKEFDENGDIGAILGITDRELLIGPQKIKLNIAYPKAEELSKARLFWLENCDNDFGPYSAQACYCWLLPEFSRLPATRNLAIRVKPTTKYDRGDKSYFDYDVIFWSEGMPVTPGHQYLFGESCIPRITGGKLLGDVIKAWEDEAYEIKFTKTLEEMESILASVDTPTMQLRQAERKLELQARDAGWSNKLPLVASFV